MATSATTHSWRFYRAGGFDQVRLESGADLMSLDQLDQKLWVALACPIAGLEFDPKTAALIDTDHDGRIRAPELIAAVQWAGGALKNPDTLIRGGDSLSLDAINDATDHGKQILASARRILAHLGQPADAPVTLAQAMDANSVFAGALFNGDGVIVPECAEDPAIAAVISEIVDCAGPVTDRSGKPGADQERADKFFDACAAFDGWMRQAEEDAPSILPAGANTAAAAAAVQAIKPKVDDYFGRCRVAAFDPRALEMLNRAKEEYLQIAAHELTIDASELAAFPLAQIAPGRALPLKTGLNPAHAAAVAALLTAAVQPLLGDHPELTEAGWAALQAKLAPYQTWKAAQAGGAVEKLGVARVRALLAGKARESVNALIARDKALEAEAANVANVEKLLRYVRDLFLLCRNFVNFSDLYVAGGPAIFQCGALYLDQRACFLCLTVEDAGRHAAMAGLSGAYLAYCDCARKGTGEKLGIVAVVSQGDDENLMVGRNGVFYDRKGRDYDATITKIVASPISLRQAFWAPYKKLVRSMEEYIAKRAAARTPMCNVFASCRDLLSDRGAPPPDAGQAVSGSERDRAVEPGGGQLGGGGGHRADLPGQGAAAVAALDAGGHRVARLGAVVAAGLHQAAEKESWPDPGRQWLGHQRQGQNQRALRRKPDHHRETAARLHPQLRRPLRRETGALAQIRRCCPVAHLDLLAAGLLRDHLPADQELGLGPAGRFATSQY